MCGISGIAGPRGTAGLDEKIRRMTAALIHRGPDDDGHWVDANAGIALGQRRLAIIDLSREGRQPMASASSRYMAVYNGEIYNFQALRDELAQRGQAPGWRGHSDTEVLLACVDAWGFEATLRKLVGMFAIALWDRESGLLSLARDRLGEKPLYYGMLDGNLAFASELKAFRAIASAPFDVDRDALAEFMRFGHVPAPRSIYRTIRKLPPGHVLSFRPAAGSAPSEPTPFWNLSSPQVLALSERFAGAGDTEIVESLDTLLRSAVSQQMISDVPLGAFLSGGVDSSTVVALMQAQSSQRVRTYTIGFQERSFNEAPYARAVADHLGTQHTELIVTADAAAQLIPSLPFIYDEPFADSSQIPTVLISRMTREHVTVSLSGDGGDELFAGYSRYQLTAALWQRVRHLPVPLRRTMARALAALSPQGWDRCIGWIPGTQARFNGRRAHHLSKLVACPTLDEMYVRLMSRWQPEDELVIGATPVAFGPLCGAGSTGDIDAMRRWDVLNYLPDDLLVKVDRAAMSTSLETRAPLLDHRVAELAMALPEHALVRNGTGKWVLREVLDRYVPRALIDRPKAGFEVPLAQWLRGPLRGWAEALLDPQRLRREAYLDAAKVSRVWQEHLSGRWDRSLHLWNVLMFESWLDAEKGLRA